MRLPIRDFLVRGMLFATFGDYRLDSIIGMSLSCDRLSQLALIVVEQRIGHESLLPVSTALPYYVDEQGEKIMGEPAFFPATGKWPSPRSRRRSPPTWRKPSVATRSPGRARRWLGVFPERIGVDRRIAIELRLDSHELLRRSQEYR